MTYKLPVHGKTIFISCIALELFFYKIDISYKESTEMTVYPRLDYCLWVSSIFHWYWLYCSKKVGTSLRSVFR